jgi:hypothetical protein
MAYRVLVDEMVPSYPSGAKDATFIGESRCIRCGVELPLSVPQTAVFGSFGGLGNMVMFLLLTNYVAALIVRASFATMSVHEVEINTRL